MVAVTGFGVPVAFVGCATRSDEHDATKRSVGQYVDDKVLIQRVKDALGDNAVYKFPDVKVNTYKGTVQLSGFVATDDQKRSAEQIARNVPGVYNIQNNITLKGETERVRGAEGTSTDIDRDRTTTTTNSVRTPTTTTPVR